jgi:hypothetical protein
MGFYFRRSAKIGPFRINFSKSGVGMSVGVKGLRVGKGPRGNYIHMTGPLGIQYRQSLNNSTTKTKRGEPDSLPSSSLNDFELIDNGNVAEMRDVGFDDILNEINLKYSSKNYWFVGLILAPIISICTFSTIADKVPSASLISWLALFVVIILSIICKNIINAKNTIYLIYNLDNEQEERANKLYEALDELKNCSAKWVVLGDRTLERNEAKQYGNAEKNIAIAVTKIEYKLPKLIASNITPLEIITGTSSAIYFFPERIIIIQNKIAGTVNYSDLKIILEEQPIIEMGIVPADATIIEKVWKYAKKDGNPDARYKDNFQLPVCAYTFITFNSDTGLNIKIKVSKRDAGKPLLELFEK